MKFKVTCPTCKGSVITSTHWLQANDRVCCPDCNKAFYPENGEPITEQVDFFDYKPEMTDKEKKHEEFAKEYLGDWWEEMKDYTD